MRIKSYEKKGYEDAGNMSHKGRTLVLEVPFLFCRAFG